MSFFLKKKPGWSFSHKSCRGEVQDLEADLKIESGSGGDEGQNVTCEFVLSVKKKIVGRKYLVVVGFDVVGDDVAKAAGMTRE